MKERRTENRMLCAELIEVIWNDHAGQPCRRLANLEDISPSGVSLQADSPIRTGTRVAIRYRDRELPGVIRYCVYREFGYFLGINLDHRCDWSDERLRPQHLLDPAELTKGEHEDEIGHLGETELVS